MKREVPYKDKKVMGTVMPFEVVRENWNEYKVSDGTTIRFRSVAGAIVKIDGERDEIGNQVYVVLSKNLVEIIDTLDGLLERK
jgi:ribosomal protein L14